MELSEYRLRQCLAGHTSDVKYAKFESSGKIISVSRDTTAKIWTQKDSVFEVETTLEGHSNYVNTVIELGKSEKFPAGAFVTGSTDSTILVWDKNNLSEPFFTLLAHSNTVCSVACGSDANVLISGSYDGTSIVWDLNTGMQKFVLDGHKPSVLCVTVLRDGNFATGGSDKLIKIWDGETGKLQQTFEGHTDAVRKLVQVDLGLCSCSNDGTVRVWDLGGECLQQYVGHQSYVYGITCMNGVQEFATCAEDQTVNVWKAGNVIQSIPHPGSVWSIEHRESENGISELLTACSDGIVRLWTKDAAYSLSEQDMSAYYKDIEKLAKEQRQSQSQSTAQEINGKRFDYVWNVDLGPEHPMLYLGHNQTDDPMDSARTFVYDNNLAVEHVQTIVEFIKKNSSPLEIVSEAPQPPQPAAPTGPPPLFPVLKPIGITSLSSLKHIKGKILAFNEEFELKESPHSLSTEHLHSLDDLVNILQDTSKYHVSRIYEDHVKLLVKLLSWPSDFAFVCNDLFRSTMVHPLGGTQIAKSCPEAVQLLIDSGMNPKASEKNLLTASQGIANLFCVGNSFSASLLQKREEILDTITTAVNNAGKVSLKPSAAAIATVLLNYSVLLSNLSGDNDASMIQCASTMLEFIKSPVIQKTNEPIFRVLVGIGTLASSSELVAGFLAAENSFIDLVNNLEDERIQKAIQMLQTLFASID